MATATHCFEYFPGNFMWSQGVNFAVEMAAWGAAALGEIDQIGRRLKGHEGDNQAWWHEWSHMAECIERLGDIAERENRGLTSGSYYLRAANYYFCGERFLPPSPEKFATYRRSLAAFEKGIARRYPNIERVEVPFEGVSLPAWFMRSPKAQSRAPTVIMFDGLDNAKEMSVLFGGVELANRGIHCLAIDGPGQGEALRLRGIASRYDYEVPATAAYEAISVRTDVDPKRVAVMGFSMGGYYAPRAAAFEKRFAACVAWGGHFDYHAVWVRRRQLMESGSMNISAPSFQLPWVMGKPDLDSAMTKLKDYTLDGIAEKIECPFLVVHGENDGIVPVEYAHQLFRAVGTVQKTLKIFTAEDGGSDHCQEDNRQVGANYVADWLLAQLNGNQAQ
jgi:dipeptidyl aminopeptidase/acylaminoacyl peptidase